MDSAAVAELKAVMKRAEAVGAALAEAGIALPEDDVAFLVAQIPMLERTIAAVRAAMREDGAP